VRRRIVSVCDVRYGCAVTQINIAVPAFEEYDYLITGGLCFSRFSTCSRHRAPVERRRTMSGQSSYLQPQVRGKIMRANP
jgi:hypothetical protein